CVERIEIPRVQAQTLGLTVQWRGPMPKTATPPRGSPWRKVCFPVAETPSSWHGHRTNSLRLVDQNLIPKFDNEQPYQRGNRYQRHWLWLLDELWNRDKHRTVAISTMYG